MVLYIYFIHVLAFTRLFPRGVHLFSTDESQLIVYTGESRVISAALALTQCSPPPLGF
jgi:hypothetical protein